MNKCLYCSKPVRNKYCDVSCQNKHQNAEKANRKFGELKPFKVLCKNCGKEFEVEEREKLFPKKEHYYCTRSCANIRTHSNETKDLISNSLLKFNTEAGKSKKHYCCLQCGVDIESYRERTFCSKSCKLKWKIENDPDWQKETSIKGGRRSVLSQNRRSKNEILFGELCMSHFNNVRLNEPMFNGWDADVILDDCKLAILWNGNWHHKQIGIKHSLAQVQNRDNIKVVEIKKIGYTPYIINDYGKYNEDFVKEEFNKLKLYLL